MKQRLYNLEGLCKALKPYLPQYLEEHNIDTSNNFQCLNPKHDDSSPSMTVRQIPEQAFCFGCGKSVDIFEAASILENKPGKGKEWIEENVLYLAKKYKIDYQLADLTGEEIYEYRTYQAYRLAAELVEDLKFGDYSVVDKEIKRRGWEKKKISSWGIGTVDYTEFRERLKKAGFEPRFLDGIDLSNPTLFNSSNLIFTVFDDEGRAVGFSAKRLDGEGSKYINTRQTGLECAIFKKGERLYGYEIAKDVAGPLYIFEGQANVVTLRHHGLLNCCAIMGTALTDHHVTLLKKHGSFNLVLVFDGDEPGQLSLQRVLDEKFSKEKDFRIKICQLPLGKDPDELVREEGFDAFVRLQKYTAFEWRMMQFSEDIKSNSDEFELEEEVKAEIASKMTPIIVSEPSHFQQETMAKQVSKMTGYDISTILSEVKRLRNEKENRVTTKKKNAVDALLKDIKINPEDVELSLAQCQKTIDDINKSTHSASEEKSTLNSILSIKEVDDNKTGEFEGFFLDPRTFGDFQYCLNGDWRKHRLFYIGGSSQASKTSFAAQLAYEIASDPRNNAMCIYHSIDDSKEVILYKWVCQGNEGDKGLSLHQNHVSNPNYWEKEIPNTKDLREKGYKKLINLVQDHRLIIKDNSDGGSFVYIEAIVRYYRELYPDRNIVLLIDNFHKLPDMAEITGHERVKRMSNTLKVSTTTNHITIIATAEYRKLAAGELPGNNALAESRSLRYDADVLFHLYNDHHENGDASDFIHQDELGNILPRITCAIGKNKVSGVETKEAFNLFPGPARLIHVDREIAIRERKERGEWLKENIKENIL